jgi:hypothetical protein
LIADADKLRLFDQILEENKTRLRIISRANGGANNYSDLEQEILLALWNSLDGYQGRSACERPQQFVLPTLKSPFYERCCNIWRMCCTSAWARRLPKSPKGWSLIT